MLSIIDNKISLTRGDTAAINLDLNYELTEQDNVVLTVKRNISTNKVILQKKLSFDSKQFIFEHSDTADLAYGKYVYDVQLTTEDGQVCTVITPHEFVLEGEVTW